VARDLGINKDTLGKLGERGKCRPYDLRHACLSTWLNGGVAATQVAEWAGHSVEMLLRVYAKCLDGQDEITRRRITAVLNDS
jgi:integrase